MSIYSDLKEWDALRKNPPQNWQEKWATRDKVDLRSNRVSAMKRLEKLQKKYNVELKMDLHPKDGYVIYYDREEVTV